MYIITHNTPTPGKKKNYVPKVRQGPSQKKGRGD